MARYRDLESKINSATGFLNTLSLGTTLLSGVLLFTPYQSVGYIGVGTGVGAFTASVVSKKKYFEAAKQHIDGLEKHHRTEIDLQTELLLSRDNEIYTLRTDNSQRYKKIEALSQELNQSGKQVAGLQNQIETLTQHNQLQKQRIERVTGEVDRLIALARTAVEESLDEWDSRLNSLVATKKELYPKLSDRLTELLREAQDLITDYGAKLSQTPNKWDSLADLLSLYYVCNDELGRVRSKAIQAIAKLTNQETLLELQEYQDAIQEWEEAKLIPRSKVEGLITKYEAMLSEFRTDLNQRFENAQSIANAMEGEITKDNEFFLRLRMKIQELEEKVNVLSNPLEWRPATRADMRVANIIIRYFHQLGVILDRAGTEYKSYEATLWFLPDHTGRLVLADELNEHSDKLQALCHTLNAPKFQLDPESGLIKVLAQLSKKPKADSSDINKLWIPADKFEQIVKGWSRVRLTGGSESGKSPTAENLAVAILKNRPGVAKLFNPQYDSVKNYWSIPTVGTSHNDSEKGITELSKRVDARSNGQESKEVFELYIFDEVDSTMSHTKGKKSVIGTSISSLSKPHTKT
jgi:predicted  nucleic acid-binding Zn-ribbon protein